MKQTNNALKFLLAQYRAIFKNAYVKGLATAVVVTAGLAVAAQPANAVDITGGADSWDAVVAETNDAAVSAPDTTLVNNKYYNNITVQSGGSIVQSSAATIGVKGNFTIESGGTVTLSTATTHIAGYNWGNNDDSSTAAGTFTNKGTLNLGPDASSANQSNSIIQFHNVVLASGSTTTINGKKDSTNGQGGTLVNSAYIMAGLGSTPGHLTVESGATVEIKDYGYLGIATEGTIQIDGTVNITASAQDSFAGIRATDAYSNSTGKWNESTSNSKVILGDTAIITVNAGSGVAAILAPDVEINGATINVAEGATFTFAGDVANKNENAGDDLVNAEGASATQVTMTSGTLNVNGTLVVNSGSFAEDNPNTPDIDESQLVSTIDIQGGELTGTGTLDVQGVLNADTTVLTNFLESGGHMSLGANNKFSFDGAVDLSDFSWASAVGTNTTLDSQYLVSAANTPVQGTDITISSDLRKTAAGDDTALTGTELKVITNKLTLGSDTLVTSADAYDGFGVASLKAQSVTFKHDTTASGDSGGAFVLKDKLTLYKGTLDTKNGCTTATEIDNPYYVSGDDTIYNGPQKFYVAAQGDTISDDLKLNAGTKALTIQDGIWTYNGNMELASGSLQVGLGSSAYSAATDQVQGRNGYGVDATLDFNGTLTLNNSGASGPNTITVAGNSTSETADGFTLGKTALGYEAKRETTATLDLRDATIRLKNEETGTNLTTIKVEEDGLLLLTEDQANYLLNTYQREDNERRGVSGAAFVLAGDGELNVAGGRLNFDVGDLTTGSSPATDQIAFNNGGVVVSSELTIADAPASDTDHDTNGLNIGGGTLVAESVALNNTHIPTNEKNYANFLVKSGNIVVGERLSGVSGLTFGNGTTAASLQLGYLNENTDEYGVFDGTYTPSAAQGTVTQDLVFNGASNNGPKSQLNVIYGDWAIQNLTATNAKITLGGDSVKLYGNNGYEYKQDADGNEYTTSLTGNDLTLNAGTNLTVQYNASAEFSTLTMTGDAQGSINNATVTINGNHLNAGSTNESWGLNTASLNGDGLTVRGRDGKLVIGDTALSSITSTLQADGKYKYANANDDLDGFVTVDDWGTLSLGFTDASLIFDVNGLSALRQDFIAGSNGTPLREGYIDLGEAKIAGIEVGADNTISWNVLDDYKDAIADILTANLKTATLVDVNSTTTVQANVGNVRADGSTSVVNFNDSSLNQANANGYFISNTTGTNPNAVGAQVTSTSRLALNNGGKLGSDVHLAAGTSNGDTTLEIYAAANEDGTTALTTIEGHVQADGDDTTFAVYGDTSVTGRVDVGTLDLHRALTVAETTEVTEGLVSVDGSGSLVSTGSLTSNGALTVTGGAYYGGDIVATAATTTFGSDAENAAEIANPRDNTVDYLLAGNNQFADVNFKHDTTLTTGTTTAKTVTLTQDLAVNGNGRLNADVLQFNGTYGGNILVGENAQGTGETTDVGSAGYLNVARLDLNGGTLLVDPSYGHAASIVAVGSLGDTNAVSTARGNAAGVLEGNIVGLQNSIIALGVTDSDPTDELSVLDEVRTTFARYLDANGSLSNTGDGAVGAVAYVAKALDVNSTSKIVLNAGMTSDRYLELRQRASANPSATEQAFLDAVNANNVYLGANTALAISDAALTAQQTENGVTGQRAAIHFESPAASIYSEKGAKVVLVGDNYNTIDNIVLFTDEGTGDNAGVLINGENLRVETLSGVFAMELKAGEQTQGGILTPTGLQEAENWYGASDPVAYLLEDYSTDRASVLNPKYHGDAAPSNIRYNPSTQTFTDITTGAAVTGYVAYEDGNGGYDIYEAAYNDLIEYTVMNERSGQSTETVARLGAYAGVAQAALAAGASTYDAISGRMGIGADASAMTFADNGQGAGLWVTPIYKNHDSDGFDADGVDYGVDMNLYGVALGADYTLSNGLRVGAMFNIGSGDADGQGAGSQASNDFDYYGFGLYAGYTMGQFSVVGDISYTTVDNDVEATLGSFDTVGASLDSTNLSFGVTGKYEFDFNGLYVTPHAGLRYSTIDIDDYDVDGEQVYAHFAADSIDVFSVPVGVTVAKEITAGSWTVKPAFDVTLTGNFGDDSFDGDVSWAGIENATTATSTEVLDNFTYGATLGVGAKTGNFSLGLGVNYTGSSNTDEFGVNANARYVF